MADETDLHRLAPTVDTEAAGTAFRRQRRRARSMRRGTWAAAAVTVMIAGTVAVVANVYDDDSPVVAGPSGEVPTVWVREPTPPGDGLAARVGGFLTRDAEHDCFLVGAGDDTYPVVWPAGSVGTADGPGVVLPGGEIARVGDLVTGDGGYIPGVVDEYGIPAACRSANGDVVVYNPNAEVTVDPTPPSVSSVPTCGAIQQFAARISDVGIQYDYDASESPEALLESADVVLSGTLTGGFGVQFDPEHVSSHVGYEVEVDVLYKGPEAARLAEKVMIWVAYSSAQYGEEATPFHDAVAYGAPVVVFAYAGEPGFTAAIEGFATACPGEAPIGRIGSTEGWQSLTSLDDLIARLDAAADGGQPEVGSVSGTFIASGGPVGTPDDPLSGTITATAADGETTTTVATDGTFELDLPAGTYTFTGVSSRYQSGDAACAAPGSTVVTPGETTAAHVVCQRR
jgi:hypothetical protein